MKQDILDLSPQELDTLLLDWGEPRYRSRQVVQWVYSRLSTQCSQMTNLPAALRERLSGEFEICRPKVVETLKSKTDGASKHLVQLHDGNLVESVLIPTEKRLTLCVSTQVGCKFGCKFCASGGGGFTRDLSAGEMLAQVLLAQRTVPQSRITHVVLMGMGEPADNLDNTLKAIKAMNNAAVFNIGWRRITLSTVGLPDTIGKILEQVPQVGLAFSLHAPDDDLRDKLVPANRTFPVASIVEAAKAYFEATGRLPTFEYILFDGINSEPGHARSLASLLKAVRCKVNLIPFNRTPLSKFAAPTAHEVELFLRTLEKAGVNATIRHSRGSDIAAACGQLARRKAEG
ncbi:MAG TPA: 23S rRNA (adenine(2503)-C(2))-methyltransferase RlmN [bacterium]|nr:23S rRNA (adenine(2503)-C(2))-methyltransferase RlmN [bacterium]